LDVCQVLFKPEHVRIPTSIRSITMSSTLAIAVFTLSLLLEAPSVFAGTVPALTNLCGVLNQGVLVTPPASVSNLMWLMGRWECVDRALRFPPADLDHYAYLKEMQFSDYSIRRSEGKGDVYYLSVYCTFSPYADGAKRQDRPVGIELSSEGFLFGLPVVDVLTLKRDPAPVPEWFLLEHTAKKDVLLFRRASEQPPPWRPPLRLRSGQAPP
jgi:hypothetical protein